VYKRQTLHRVVTESGSPESSRIQGRLEDFARLSNAWFWELDDNLRYCYLSKRFTDLTGIPTSLVLGMTDEETGMAEDDPDASRAYLANLCAHRSFRNFQYSRTHPDGHTVNVSVNGDAVFDPSGTFLGYRGTGTEISNHIEADKAVAQVRAIYQLAEQVAKIGYWEWDEVTEKCLYCSDELARMHGVSVEEYMRISTSNAADRQWVHPDDRARYERATRKFTDEGLGYDFECRMLRADGTIITVREVAAPIFDHNRTVVRSTGFVIDITASKQAAIALEKVTALYSQTEALAKIGHFEWDEVNDKATYCSEEFARLLGVSVEEYLRRSISTAADLKWTHPDDRDYYATAIQKYDSQPITTEIEYRLVEGIGGIRSVREVISPVFDQDGSLVRSIGYVQDISESKKIETLLEQARDDLEQRVRDRTTDLRKSNAELIEHEQRLRAAAGVAKLGWFKWDEITDCAIQYDEEITKIFGVSAADCAQESIADYLGRVHPDDRERVREIYKDDYHGKKQLDFGYRIVRPDGEVRHVHEFVGTMVEEDGSPCQSFGILQDVTDRKILAEALTETEIRLNDISSNSHEVFWILSADGQCVHYISPAYEEVWGRPCQPLLDDPSQWITSVHPDDRETLTAEMHDRISGKVSRPNLSHYRIIRPDGTVRWRATRIYSIRDDNERIVRFVGVGEDVTERKAATSALHQSQKLKAIGQLTGGVAHDFNNLLAIMLGNAELLQAGLSPEDEPLVKDIIDAGKRGADLTRPVSYTHLTLPTKRIV